MRQWNEKAWDILNPDEKTAITLQIVKGKSTWEAGEIMGKAHYKYLEIFQRAKRLLGLFTDHYEKYDNQLITDDTKVSPAFRQYIAGVIEKRLNISEAADDISDVELRPRTYREKMIIDEMLKLSKSQFAAERNLYNTIIEFDRWNNFRVLPIPVQEPSAYKRRNKNRHKKYIRDLLAIHPLAIQNFKRRFHRAEDTGFYVPLIRDIQGKGIIMNIVKGNVERFTKLSIFIFSDKQIAKEFLALIIKFLEQRKKTCRVGLDFWEKYRELITKAHNYNEVNHIVEFRKPIELESIS